MLYLHISNANIIEIVELDTEQKIESHFPVSEATTDYLNASSDIRDNRSRIVTVTFRVASLFLDAAARDKFLRLVGETRATGALLLHPLEAQP